MNGSLLTPTRSRARPTRERGRPARIRPGNLQRTLQKRLRHPSQSRNREREPPYSNKATSETPPGSAGVPPAYDLAICNEPCNGGFATPRKRETVNGSLPTATKSTSRDPTRERGRPARTRPRNLQRTLQWRVRHPSQSSDREREPACTNKVYGRDPTRERGRPARTRPRNLQRTLQWRVRRPSQTSDREQEPPYSTNVYERDPTRERGRLARIRPRNRATIPSKVASPHLAKEYP